MSNNFLATKKRNLIQLAVRLQTAATLSLVLGVGEAVLDLLGGLGKESVAVVQPLK